MSEEIYLDSEDGSDKPLVWLHGEVKSPPFSSQARREAGYLLRRLQRGDVLSLLKSRPLPGIGARCHELRIQDRNIAWRIVYRVDSDAILILDVFQKSSEQTPRNVMQICRKRLNQYDREAGDEQGQETPA
ncbi:MAG TPA: type II toxin-antitoxin system RelE/ParE family toxin [Bacteroidota bacterium]|nr:type II toxin-antitoxin system RelE/ParE family toxin [Bacteroidota bacterium]